MARSIDINDYTDTTHVKFIIGDQNVFFIQFNNTKGLKLPDDKKSLNTLFSLAGSLSIADMSYMNLLKNQLDYNKQLSALLKKEYHL